MAVNNKHNISKSFPEICYVKDCHNVATKVIDIPLNEKKSCLIDVCQPCLEDFRKRGLISCDSFATDLIWHRVSAEKDCMTDVRSDSAGDT